MKKIFLAILFVVIGISALRSEELTALPVTEHNGKQCYFLQVQPKETVYSLTHRFNISVEQLMKWNPEVADGLKAYEMLYFPVNEVKATNDVVTYTVLPKETVYGLSKKFGITTDEFLAMNPEAKDGLKAGQVITISKGTAAQTDTSDDNVSKYSVKVPGSEKSAEKKEQAAAATDKPAAAAEQPAEKVETAVAEQVEAVKKDEKGPIRIAVMLPFMLNSSTPGKPAMRYTEFFRGFLMGVDTLATRHGARPVKVYAYDTAGSTDTIKSILKKRPELQEVDLIIAPDTEVHLNLLAEFGQQHDIPVLNNFVVKDDSYLKNSAMMQGNIPLQQMFARSIDEMMKRFPDHTPVVLTRKGGATDRTEFVKMLKDYAADAGKEVIDITFEDKLTEADLAKLAPRKHLFVTVSGRQAEVNKVLPALVAYKEKAPDIDNVIVMGYPEWITYRGETLQNMQAANTYVFTRFYNNPEDLQTRPADEAYKRLYGANMEEAMPRMGLMGYDTALYLVPALSKGLPGPAYSGLQNGFDFVREDNGGWLNKSIYLVNYRPSGMIDRTLISR